MKKSIVVASLFMATCSFFAQSKEEQTLKDIYKSSLTNAKCYPWLDHLSNAIGSRLSGSAGAEKAVLYTKAQLETLGLDKVYLQEVMVPKWVRGEKETGYLQLGKQKISFPICALGGSVATPKKGLQSTVIEVKSLEELAALGEEKVKGKIIFFNRPMNPEFVETFKAYSGCVDQRSSGAREAGKLGALAVIVRSMNLRLDDLPHTGATNYGDIAKEQRIPAAAISTNGAELLSKSLKANPNGSFYLKQSCETFEDVLSYNVVGEMTGTEHPEQIMVVGGHLDSWDLGDGSHDDGAGCVQSMEVFNIFKNIGYKPKNTLRVVLFMNEENGVKGGKEYEIQSSKNKENHIFALESDSGGFSPRGFSIDADEVNFNQIKSWGSLFEPFLIHKFVKGHSGVDIGPLQSKHIVKVGLQPDSQRYFDHHHASNDTFDAVHKRELELGAAAMASLVYLMDQNGIAK
ncbi:M28 family peptidase [Flavobacterium sp. CHNK8]|uniref:M28 family peptidase n=1 Tax=Flavobacterium sp. CHNK8 TaxID=2871165 RepID=UPI001C8D7397|nr:M28 family peptidase [Flavobacterium sp. CHNK8]QZK90160.1 M28 family peptidase [Flavobacterium sp. CHNK8]